MVINGVTVKEPAKGGITITDEPIWASNTGRNSKGKMIGDMIAMKTTIEVKWGMLTFSELHAIQNAITSGMRSNNGFFNITYPDTNASGQDTTTTKRVYAGNVPRTMYSRNSKARYFMDVTVKFVEQ